MGCADSQKILPFLLRLCISEEENVLRQWWMMLVFAIVCARTITSIQLKVGKIA